MRISYWSSDGCSSDRWGYRDGGRAQREPLDLPRARVVGGCSTNNACTWVRGSGRDYDAWATAGNSRWAFDDLIPRFRRAERDGLPGEPNGRAACRTRG